MLEHTVGVMTLVNEKGKPVGILTESDIFRMLVGHWDYFTVQHIDPGLMASLIAQEIGNH